MKTGKQLIDEAKTRIREVSAADVAGMLERKAPVVVLDCREPQEWNLGRIPGAVHIPRGQIETKVETMIPRDASVVIYCAGGNRSALAADTMQVMGYADVTSMAGGWAAWMQVGGPVDG